MLITWEVIRLQEFLEGLKEFSTYIILYKSMKECDPEKAEVSLAIQSSCERPFVCFQGQCAAMFACQSSISNVLQWYSCHGAICNTNRCLPAPKDAICSMAKLHTVHKCSTLARC